MGKWASLLILALGLSACSSHWSEDARHCYRTLARVDCHTAPLKGEESRLVGAYGDFWF